MFTSKIEKILFVINLLSYEILTFITVIYGKNATPVVSATLLKIGLKNLKIS